LKDRPIQATLQDNLADSKRENFELSSGSVGAEKSDFMDADETHALTKPQWDAFKAPDYPCTWNVQVGRGDLGQNALWRQMTVKGNRDDHFYFHGCTTSGEVAYVCQQSENAPGGARILKNSKDEIVGFGGCCKPEMVNTVIEARIGSCSDGSGPASASSSAKDASGLNSFNTASLHYGSMVFRASLLIGCCLVMSALFYMRYKK